MRTNPPPGLVSPGTRDEGGVRQEHSTLTTGPSSKRGAYKARPERGRLAAREKGQMKAWTLFGTRGVRSAHTPDAQGARPAAAPGADVRAFRHSRSRRVRGA
jgi:hypothetical protein